MVISSVPKPQETIDSGVQKAGSSSSSAAKIIPLPSFKPASDEGAAEHAECAENTRTEIESQPAIQEPIKSGVFVREIDECPLASMGARDCGEPWGRSSPEPCL